MTKEQALNEIHCKAENIIDGLEFGPMCSVDYILEKACEILDIALDRHED